MLWLESVIGTALWCWWQVPARRANGASGRFELDWRLGAFAARSCCDVTVFMGRQSKTPPKKRGPPATGKGEPILVRLQPASSGSIAKTALRAEQNEFFLDAGATNLEN